MAFSNNFGGLFWSDKTIQCPYCQIKFSTVPQLKSHKESYCTPEANFEILDDMFDNLSEDIAKNGIKSMLNEKNVIILKGLYYLRSDWQNYLQFLEDPKKNILAEQEKKKSSEENTRKPHFEAMFSDFNPDAENIKKYPVLEGHLENHFGENLNSFGIVGEGTDPDKEANLPSWLKGEVKEDKKAQDKQNNNYIDGLTDEDLLKFKNIDMSTGKKMFESPSYLKLFNAMRNDTGLDMRANDVQFFLKEPAKNWEADFFDT